MRVGTLRRIAVYGLSRSLQDFYLEADWQLLGRVAGGVVTGLVLEDPMDGVPRRHHSPQRPHQHLEREVSSIDI